MKRRAYLLPIVVASAICAAVVTSPTDSARAIPSEGPFLPVGDGVATSVPVTSMIVKFRKGSSPIDAIGVVARLGRANTNLRVLQLGEQETVVLGLEESVGTEEALELADAIESDSRIEWAEPNFVARHHAFPSNPPNDEYWNRQWSLWGSQGLGIGSSATSMNSVWTRGRGAGVTVAVLDTGVIAHPDLARQTVTGYDFVSGFDTPYLREFGVPASFSNFDGDVVDTGLYGKAGRDNNTLDPGDWYRGYNPYLDDFFLKPSSWHGTHVAGTIAAVANNRIGIAGVAPASKILPIRVLSWQGGLTSDIADAIRWAAGGSVSGVPKNRTPAKVINLSLGGFGPCGNYMQNAIDAAGGLGAVVVVAAGNDSRDASEYSPANCRNVVTVAATGPSGDLAGYSNHGESVDLAAPGGDFLESGEFDLVDGVLSTLSYTAAGIGHPQHPGGPPQPGYGFYQGTSMATPHVSGALATLWSFKPTWSATRITQRLLDTAVEPGPNCMLVGCGSGIVNLSQAMAAMAPDGPTKVRVRAGAGSASVTWKAPASNGGSPITGYSARAYTVAGGGEVAGSCTTTGRLGCSISGLARSSTYFVEVVATNVMGSSDPSAPRIQFRTR